MRDVIINLPSWLTEVNNGPSPPTTTPSKLTIIFLITGNPGLIAYYRTFLKLLAEGRGKSAIVAGASLGGFETSSSTVTNDPLKNELVYPLLFAQKPIYDLQDQIRLTNMRLITLVHNLKNTYPVTRDLPIEVVLMGHSVGAYIALELVRHQHESWLSDRVPTFTITATMLLTPTIQNIAHSASGKIATPLLSNVPLFPALIQGGASALTSIMRETWLKTMVSRVTGMSYDSDGLKATVGFLRTPGAVKQALHMARCEMAEIQKDEWTEEVWGAAESAGLNEEIVAELQNEYAKEGKGAYTSKPPAQTEITGASKPVAPKAPKHYFLFANEDHWVADATRDAIVKAMGGRAKIVVDEPGVRGKGLVHAWCLGQSEMVADIVNGWLEDINTSKRRISRS